MNFKKLAITGATAAIVFGQAAGAFASFPHFSSNDTTVTNAGLFQSNHVTTKANSGHNATSGWFAGISTGNASAYSEVGNLVNTNLGCGCGSNGDTSVSNTGIYQGNSVNTKANSGYNVSWGGSIHTGGASAGALVSNVVNTSVGGSE